MNYPTCTSSHGTVILFAFIRQNKGTCYTVGNRPCQLASGCARLQEKTGEQGISQSKALKRIVFNC